MRLKNLLKKEAYFKLLTIIKNYRNIASRPYKNYISILNIEIYDHRTTEI